MSAQVSRGSAGEYQADERAFLPILIGRYLGLSVQSVHNFRAGMVYLTSLLISPA